LKKAGIIFGNLGFYSYISSVIEIDMRLSIETLKKIETEFGSFDIAQVVGGANNVYLRFGYWNRVDVQKLQEMVGNVVIVREDDIDDDDCGTLYSYKMLDPFFS
jgi:hypothetical protein